MPTATKPAPLTEADILNALRDCYDPNVPLNIVDLGLVSNIAVAPDPDAPGAGIPGVPPRQRVAIALTPLRLADTESEAAPLIAQIQNRLAAFETIHRTEVSLLNHPVWTPDRISPEGYARLATHLKSKRPPNALIQIEDHPAKPSLVAPAIRPRDRLQLADFPIHPFDQAHGVDTSGLVPARHLVTGHANDEHVTAYYAVAPSILRALIGHWRETIPPHPISSYAFIDVGAGKGRVLLLASEFRFRKVVGIELNPSLAAIARQNVAHWSHAHSEDPTSGPLAPIEIAEGDALDFQLPSTPVLLFLFHPFEAPVLRQLLRRIETQFAARPKTARGSAPQPALDLIYVNAECANVLDRNPAFTQLFLDSVKMSPEDHAADLEAIARQREYGSSGDEECAIYRYTGRAQGPIFNPAA